MTVDYMEIIESVLGMGTDIASAVLAADAQEEAKIEARQLADRARKDSKEIFAHKQKMDKFGIKMAEEGFAFKKREARQAKKERKEAKEYQINQNTIDRGLNFLNNNAIARSAFHQIWNRR